MKKPTRLPHEGAANNKDGLPADTDVEGHRQDQPVDEFAPRLPGTGGDQYRRPTSGGEIDDRDVEGHGLGSPDDFGSRLPGTGGDRLAPRLPGTGGDRLRRPTGGGELGDDIEGHS